MNPPVAFLSHSSKDSELAQHLAEDLQSRGVKVWYSEWEIRLGDSLRRKIDEGIGQATHFLVLLTPNSLASEWVQTELDAGMVRKIEGVCRLIPIFSNINEEQIPLTLRGILGTKLDPYETGLRKLVEVCLDVTIKPSLGNPPLWASEKLLSATGLSVHAQRLAALLNGRSERGLPYETRLSAVEVLHELDIIEDEAAIAADELEEQGLVHLTKLVGMGNVGFSMISPTASLFFLTDPYLKGWSPETDAKALAAAAVNTGKENASLAEMDKLLSWGPRRLNPAADFLIFYDYVQSFNTRGSAPYITHGFRVTLKTRRFAMSV